jgi:hypothetical protein
LLCCFLIALAATPAGAWLIRPPALACCGISSWATPLALAFALTMAAAMAVWAGLWLLLPRFDAFQPFCRVGALLMRAVN